MRHRITDINTGLGNPEKCLMNNEWTTNDNLNEIIKQMLSEGIDLWFKNIGGVDFDIELENNEITINFGIEPGYKYEKLKMFSISTNKENCSYTTGIAWDFYGSGIAKKTRNYSDYKKNGKFKKFVDKWSNQLNEFVAA